MIMSLQLKKIIKQKGLTIQEVAEKMGINRVGLSKHISGNPSVEILQRIADAINVDIVELFEQKKNNDFICPECGTKFKMIKEH
jgi:transcriptional regulator with XRE-family HTH domain